ncbi:hypothetical protein LX32DRAFT_687196 [Colletotrichum zoysiae]|uniref:Uncharacterized protein n=1 Tax=Colletotrichum zoysiae TaxID=1216348 RepID=A0AAD9LXX7_9PEZI|nr:hypothetical protein LX32DRAFT_687196 [Colletotrichum zoysiae]
MVSITYDHYSYFEQSFLNHLGDWRHNVLARSQLNELQPDGDQNLKPYYCYWLFLAKCFVSLLVAEYWKYNHYTHFAQDIRHSNANFHHLGYWTHYSNDRYGYFCTSVSCQLNIVALGYHSTPYRQQHESQSFLEFNSGTFIYTWCFGFVDRGNTSQLIMDCKCQCYLDSHQSRKRSSNFGNGVYRDAKFRQCSSLAGLQLHDIDLGNWHYIKSHADWHRDSFQQFPVGLFPLEQFDLVPPAYWYLDRIYHYGERRCDDYPVATERYLDIKGKHHWVRTSTTLLSTVLTGTGATTASTNMTFTSTGSPTLPTANTTSSLVATRNATFTVSGSVITLVSTLTRVPATLTGSVTGPTGNVTITLISGTESGPLVSTSTATWANGSVTEIITSASSSGMSSSLRTPSNTRSDNSVWHGVFNNLVGRNYLWWSCNGHLKLNVRLSFLVTSIPQFDHHLWRSADNSSLLDHIRNRVFFFVYTTRTHASTFQLICGCSTLICNNAAVHFLGNVYFCVHTFLIHQQFASIAISIERHLRPTNHYELHGPSCTSRWQNLTSTSSTARFASTWTSLALANLTSSSLDRATTFITSTTRRPGDPSGEDDGFSSESNFVFGTPTTTITDAPLPSNTAYPWGGLGPIFRPHGKLEPEKGGVSAPKLKGRKVHAA